MPAIISPLRRKRSSIWPLSPRCIADGFRMMRVFSIRGFCGVCCCRCGFLGGQLLEGVNDFHRDIPKVNIFREIAAFCPRFFSEIALFSARTSSAALYKSDHYAKICFTTCFCSMTFSPSFPHQNLCSRMWIFVIFHNAINVTSESLSKHSDYSPTVLRHLGLIINFVARKSGGANAADSR